MKVKTCCMDGLKAVRVDPRTVIYVKKNVPDDEARRKHFERISLSPPDRKGYKVAKKKQSEDVEIDQNDILQEVLPVEIDEEEDNCYD